MLKVGLIGLGQTGIELAKYLLNAKEVKLVMVLTREGSSKVGKDLGELIETEHTGIVVGQMSDLTQAIFRDKPQVVIDFSTPEDTIRNTKILAQWKVNMIIGTTGITPFNLKRLYILAHKYKVGIAYTPNVTFGANIMMLVANLAASLCSDYDFEIIEVHHKQKKDAPSGTAIKLAEGLQKTLPDKSINISTVRAGGVIGQHKVMIIGEDDKIEISHESFSRAAFAKGALQAANFIKDKIGFYEMNDILNVEKQIINYFEDNKMHKGLTRNLS